MRVTFLVRRAILQLPIPIARKNYPFFALLAVEFMCMNRGNAALLMPFFIGIEVYRAITKVTQCS